MQIQVQMQIQKHAEILNLHLNLKISETSNQKIIEPIEQGDFKHQPHTHSDLNIYLLGHKQ